MKKILNMLFIITIALTSLSVVAMDVESVEDEKKEFITMEELGKAIDEYISTLPVEEQEGFKQRVDKYSDFSNLTSEEQLAFHRFFAQRFDYPYLEVLLELIVDQAKNILYGPFDSRAEDKKTLAALMNDEELDAEIKNAIGDDIAIIIKEAYGKNITRRVSNAYQHLYCVVTGIINARFHIIPQWKIERAIDFISRKFQEVKLGICDRWYRQRVEE